MPGHAANSAPMCAQPRCQKKSGPKLPRMWAPAAWQTPHAGPARARRAHYSTAYHSVIMYAGWAGGGRPAPRQHGRSNVRIRPSQAAGTIVLTASQAGRGTHQPASPRARATTTPLHRDAIACTHAHMVRQRAGCAAGVTHRLSQAAGTIVLKVSQAGLGHPPASQPARAPQPPCCVLHHKLSEVCACEAGARRVRAGPAGAMLQVWGRRLRSHASIP